MFKSLKNLYLGFFLLNLLENNLFLQNNIMIISDVFFNGGGSVYLQKQFDKNILLFVKI